MSLSGIILNHPKLISRFNTPAWLIPSPYDVHYWNQGTLRKGLYINDNRVIFGGLRGIWESCNGGRSFSDFNQGLSPDLFYRKTNDMFFDHETHILLAATDGGLFQRKENESTWQKVPLNPGVASPVKRILYTGAEFVVITNSEFFKAEHPSGPFLPITLKRPDSGVELIKVFFDLHDGKIWGLPGKLLFDLTGLVLFFLCVSAFLIWIFPGLKQSKGQSWHDRIKKVFKFCFKYHLKWSIWFGLPLIIIGTTGIFMRPPLLVLLVGNSLSRTFYPGPIPRNPWYQKIKNATYSKSTHKLIVEADSLWSGDLNTDDPMQLLNWDAPVHVMGTTVFEECQPGQFLLGSFSGLLDFWPKDNRSIDHLNGKVVHERSRVRPSDFLVTGYFSLPDGREFIASHHKGLVEITHEGLIPIKDNFDMPPGIDSVPLWDFLFELHNGRIFSKWIGIWSKLLVPAASILYVILSLTGFYDWYIVTFYRKRRSGK